jgi:hypothetical protein
MGYSKLVNINPMDQSIVVLKDLSVLNKQFNILSIFYGVVISFCSCTVWLEYCTALKCRCIAFLENWFSGSAVKPLSLAIRILNNSNIS